MAERKRDNIYFRLRALCHIYGEMEWLKVKSLARQCYGFKPIGCELGIYWRIGKVLFFMPDQPNAKSKEKESLLDNFKSVING